MKANDKLLTVGARGLLRPLAAQVQTNQPLSPLNDQEVEPLWELAAAKDEHLRQRFVELGLADPDSASTSARRPPAPGYSRSCPGDISAAATGFQIAPS